MRCLFGHKWEYRLDERILMDNIFHNIRFCKRCFKKEKVIKSEYLIQHNHKLHHYEEAPLNKEELRLKNLKSLIK